MKKNGKENYCHGNVYYLDFWKKTSQLSFEYELTSGSINIKKVDLTGNRESSQKQKQKQKNVIMQQKIRNNALSLI